MLSTFNYTVVILGIFWALSILGVDIATLFASLGILALVVGFDANITDAINTVVLEGLSHYHLYP